MGSPQRERTGTGGQPRCCGFTMLSRSSANSRKATRHAVMLGARAIGSRARGLSPRTGGLAVDSPCPPLLSQRERCHLSQVSALCTLCSCLSTGGWWGGHPVNTYPVGTCFGTPSALCPFSSLSTSRWWGGHPVDASPVGTRFGTPPALCTLSSLFHLLLDRGPALTAKQKPANDPDPVEPEPLIVPLQQHPQPRAGRTRDVPTGHYFHTASPKQRAAGRMWRRICD